MPSPLSSGPGLSPRASSAHELARTLSSVDDHDGLDDLLEHTRRTTRSTWAHFSLLTDRQVTAAACGPSGALVEPGQEIAFDDTICATVLRTGEAVIIPDTSLDARVSSIPAVRQGLVGAYLGVPIHLDSLLVGVLCVVDEQSREWSVLDTACLDAAAVTLREELLRPLLTRA